MKRKKKVISWGILEQKDKVTESIYKTLIAEIFQSTGKEIGIQI